MEEFFNKGENHEESRDYIANGTKTCYSSEGRELRPRMEVVIGKKKCSKIGNNGETVLRINALK